MRVLIEQELQMRRGNWVWVRTIEEEPSGKVHRRNYLIDTRNGERSPTTAKSARQKIESIGQGRLF